MSQQFTFLCIVPLSLARALFPPHLLLGLLGLLGIVPLVLVLLELRRRRHRRRLVVLSLSLCVLPTSNLCEGNGANVFVVKNGIVRTPPRRMVLAGISRDVAFELCAKLGILCEEATLDLFDVYGADETFITSTSWAICGIREINGRQVGGSTQDQPHGPVTTQLMQAYCELVQCDYIAQYRDAA